MSHHEKFQNKPVEAGSGDATDDEKLIGIIAQMRHDSGLGHTDTPELDQVRRRAQESGVQVSDDRLRELLAEKRKSVTGEAAEGAP